MDFNMDEEMNINRECSLLASDTSLKAIIERSKTDSVHSHMKDSYQLIDTLPVVISRNAFIAKRKLGGTLTVHKHFVTYIAEKKVPR